MYTGDNIDFWLMNVFEKQIIFVAENVPLLGELQHLP